MNMVLKELNKQKVNWNFKKSFLVKQLKKLKPIVKKAFAQHHWKIVAHTFSKFDTKHF